MIYIPHFVQLNWNVEVDLSIVCAIEFFQRPYFYQNTVLKWNFHINGPLTLFTCVGQIVTIRLKYKSVL